VKLGLHRHNPWLLQAFIAHPPNTWTFELLQELQPGCDLVELRLAEQIHIDHLRSWDPVHGFNMRPANSDIASPECREAHRQLIVTMNAATMTKWRENNALKKRGALTSVRLTDSPRARSYNIVSEVEVLARGEPGGEKLQSGSVGRDASRDESAASAPNSVKPGLKKRAGLAL
jgi:hypothetical protein